MVERKHTIIIAEAGVNHNGSMAAAKQLIDVAADAGADYVKFQTFKAEKLVSPTAEKAAYQKANIGDGDNTQFGMLKKLELSEADHHELIKHCHQKNIRFLSTPFDEESANFLYELQIPLFKIPSGEITNKPFLQHLASKGLPIILSTGMATIEEIESAIQVLEEKGLSREKITVLHCNTEYPTPMKDVNLLAMNHIKNTIGVAVGYSDHTLGIEVPIAAVALGATVIEKHFTLDRTLPGPDHAASLEPQELKAMVRAIRNIELAVSGSGIKEPSESEIKNILIGRKSLHLARNVEAGEICKVEDLIALRPGNGICPMAIDTLIGKHYTKKIEAFTQLKSTDLV
jgi:N-acetylneuraminate synthase/N,N'-diacetyllegionaminate synthase